MGITLIALLLEGLLRLLDLLSSATTVSASWTQLAVNLVPHYVGLTLPARFSSRWSSS